MGASFSSHCEYGNGGDLCELRDFVWLARDKQEKFDRLDNIQPGNIATIVKINSSNIEYLPKDLAISFPHLKVVEMESSVQLPDLNTSFFEDHFPELESLRFWKCSIKSIQENSFEKLPALHEIRMNDCEIRSLDPDVFQGNLELREIFFSGNKIRVLPKGIFRNLGELKRILFILNQIRILDKDLFRDNKRLRYIHFSVNRIQQLDPLLFRGLVELEEIGFSGNQIKILRENLFQDNLNLRIIRLYYNKIKKIHPALFQNLQQLEHFGLDPNTCFNRSFSVEFYKKHSRNFFLVDLRVCYENWELSRNLVEQGWYKLVAALIFFNIPF
jgi:Leucine-rich repeat (LRR) protein